jgi:hypothetical protein
MRCISPYSNYSIQILEALPRRGTDQTGTVVEYYERKPVVANFSQGGLLDHEIAAAFQTFNFSGIPDGVNPLTRISSFDTEAYAEQFPEKEREQILEELEDRLRVLQKLHPSEFIIVDQPRAAKPFGESSKYDELSAEEVIELQASTGYSPEAIRLYELENQNRQEVVDAMTALEERASEEAIVVGA